MRQVFAWTAILALPQLRVRKEPVQHPADLGDIVVALLRRVRVPVVDNPREEVLVGAHLAYALLDLLRYAAAERKRADPGVGYVAPDDSRRPHVIRDDLRRRAVWLVPHRPVAHPALEVLRERVDPVVPPAQLLRGRRELRPEVESALVVVSVAVLRAEVAGYPVLRGGVHNVVQPGEVVDTLDLLALLPTAHQADYLDAEWREKAAVVVEVYKVAVTAFAAEGPVRGSNLVRRSRAQRSRSAERNAERRLDAISGSVDFRRRAACAQRR